MFCGPYVHWRHRRGRKNFCLQKSRMPLAGLVYLVFKKIHDIFHTGPSTNQSDEESQSDVSSDEDEDEDKDYIVIKGNEVRDADQKLLPKGPTRSSSAEVRTEAERRRLQKVMVCYSRKYKSNLVALL